jgi:hypothetical protein
LHERNVTRDQTNHKWSVLFGAGWPRILETAFAFHDSMIKRTGE